jgi:hypothetical protein
MSLSTFALVIGVTWYVMGFPLVFSEKRVTTWRKRMMKDETVLRYMGVLWAVLAVLALKHQSSLTPDADGLIVLIAWIILVKALFISWWPEQYSQLRMNFEQKWFRTHESHMTLGVVMLALGAFFTYLGLILI